MISKLMVTVVMMTIIHMEVLVAAVASGWFVITSYKSLMDTRTDARAGAMMTIFFAVTFIVFRGSVLMAIGVRIHEIVVVGIIPVMVFI